MFDSSVLQNSSWNKRFVDRKKMWLTTNFSSGTVEERGSGMAYSKSWRGKTTGNQVKLSFNNESDNKTSLNK